MGLSAASPYHDALRSKRIGNYERSLALLLGTAVPRFGLVAAFTFARGLETARFATALALANGLDFFAPLVSFRLCSFPVSAAPPTMVPITPPTSAPTGPPTTAPITAPVVPPATFFRM